MVLIRFQPAKKILQARPPTFGQPVRQLAPAPINPIQKALPGETEQVTVDGSSIQGPMEPRAQFIGGKNPV